MTNIKITGGDRELNIRAHRIIDNRVYVSTHTAQIIKVLRHPPSLIKQWYLDGSEIEILAQRSK